jgi:creatinine amidohydrolase
MDDVREPLFAKGIDYAAQSWRAIDEQRAKMEQPLVVVPSGATEVYGPHLPLCSDSIVAASVARRVARELGAVCTPVIPVGYSRDLMSHPGTLTVTPDAFLAYFEGICLSLVHWGFEDLLFLNTHAGNVGLIDQVALDLIEEHGVRCLQVDWWRYANRVAADLMSGGPWVVGHAGELGTSVLLEVAPELVDLSAAVDEEPVGDPWPSGLERYYDYGDFSESGVMGRPSLASVEKGKAIVGRCVEQICRDAREHFGEEEPG